MRTVYADGDMTMMYLLRDTSIREYVKLVVLRQIVASTAFTIAHSFFRRLAKSMVADDHRPFERHGVAIGSLYVHIPFCRRPCRFCCFLRYEYEPGRYWLYMRHLMRELENVVSMLDINHPEVYIGGGTPTINPDGLLQLLDVIHELTQPRSVTVEANPSTLSPELAKELSHKVTRLSIGVQSLSPIILSKIGRRNHTVSDAIRAAALARKYFKVVNVDLLWDVPGQNPSQLRRDSRLFARLGIPQLTFYPILKPPSFAPYETVASFLTYKTIVETMRELGYSARTVWHFSNTRSIDMVDEYIVAHYDFVGVGAGSISKIGTKVTANAFSLRNYVKLIRKKGVSTMYATDLSYAENMLYKYSMRLFELRLSSPEILNYLKTALSKIFYRILKSNVEDSQINVEQMYFIGEVMRSLFAAVAAFRYTAIEHELA